MTSTAFAPYAYPPELAPSDEFRVRIAGQEVFVLPTTESALAIAEVSGPVEVEIDVRRDVRNVAVRPLGKGVIPRVDGNTIRLHVPGPMDLSVEIDGDLRKPLFLLLASPDADGPDPADPAVRYFQAGRVHEVGTLELTDGQTVYIAGGAVVRGHITAEHAAGLRIAGRGVLDGSCTPRAAKGPRPRMIGLGDCRDVSIEGITIINGPGWTCVPTGCRDVRIDGLRIVSDHVGGDGIDLVGSSDVTVRNCFLRADDDCVVCKASAYRVDYGGRDVRNVLVEGCTCWNGLPGNALEIGYETRCDEMCDITFRDIDVIHCEREGHQSGGVLTIHNGDRADVHDILYEDIRIEDAQEKLIDFKVLVAKYTRENTRGRVRDVTVRNVRVVEGPFPVSIIRGWEGEHGSDEYIPVENVSIEGLCIHGQLIRDQLAAHMVAELARGVTFR